VLLNGRANNFRFAPCIRGSKEENTSMEPLGSAFLNWRYQGDFRNPLPILWITWKATGSATQTAPGDILITGP
jgi:hypothetical protein